MCNPCRLANFDEISEFVEELGVETCIFYAIMSKNIVKSQKQELIPNIYRNSWYLNSCRSILNRITPQNPWVHSLDGFSQISSSILLCSMTLCDIAKRTLH